MNKKLLGRAVGHALLAYAYIFCIAIGFKITSKNTFNNVPEFFAPIIMLSLLVLSAAIMAILVFGRPVMLYLDNQKKDAVVMLFYTIGCLAALFVITISILLILY